jgi:mRNA-degrading endonuclease toxin of MazEF toxin-antitoxin module
VRALNGPINRGDLWWVDFDFGLHPGVVVSRQVSIPVRTTVTVVLVTSQVRGAPAEVALDTHVGLSHPSVANCDEIYTVGKDALVEKVGALRLEDRLQVDHALRISLDLI